MKGERKPLTFWASFIERKSQLLYLDYFKQDQAVKQMYFSAITILKSTIILLTRKQYCNDNYIFLSFITMIIQFGTVLLFRKKPLLLKKSHFINTIIETISSFDIMMIQESHKRESEVLFFIKITIDVIFLQSSALIQNANWQQSFKRTTIVSLFTVVMRYTFFSHTFSLGKLFILAVVLILLQLYLLVPIVQIEGKMKTLWFQWSESKKQFKAIDSLLTQLPVPVLIFNEQFQILIQSLLAYRILPKEVDIVEKKYFNKPLKLDHISLKEQDIETLKQTALKVIADGELKVLSVAILGQQGPSTFYMQRVLYKRSNCVLLTCVQNSDEQTIDYNHAMQDQQLKLLDQMSLIISREEKYSAQVMILQLMSIRCPLSIFPYQQQCNVNFHLRNYLSFYMDMLSLSCLDNISLTLKHNNDLPVIVSSDILRLHYTLMQLVAFVSKQYMHKQKKLGSMRVIDVRGSEKILDAADNIDNMFLVCEKQVIEGQLDAANEFTVRIGFEFNFTNPISENQMIFQDFDYKNSHQVAEGGFYHIYRIAKNSFGGDLQIFEKSQTLKIDLIIPFHHQEGGATHNALLTQYQSQGKCSEGSKNLIQWMKEDIRDWKQVKLIQSSHSDSSINAKRNVRMMSNVKVIHEENSKLQSDDDDHCSIVQSKQQNLQMKSKIIEFNFIPSGLPSKKNSQQEEEKKITLKKNGKDPFYFPSPSLSPIPQSQPMQQRSHPIERKESKVTIVQDTENFELNDNITKHMHFITKGVSKTLENILQEIMQYKGKRVNIHFKSNKKKQQAASFENSPEPSERKLPTPERNQTAPRLGGLVEQKPSLFRQLAPIQMESQKNIQVPTANFIITEKISTQKNDQEPKPELVKKTSKMNKCSSLLKELNRNDSHVSQFEQNQQLIAQNTSIHIMNIQASQQPSDFKGQISPGQTIYSFQQIPNTCPEQVSSSTEKLDRVPEEKNLDDDYNIDHRNNSIMEMKIEEEDTQQLQSTDRTEVPQNSSPPKEIPQSKFKYCDIITLMLVDDFVFVLNAVQGMKLSMERKVEAFSKGTEAIEAFKNHLNQGLLYHFLLIDFSMPARFWDGYKLVEMIRSFEKEVDAPPAYIIGLDNDLDDDKLEDSLKRGFNSAIEKPLNPIKLTQIIQDRIKDLGL